MRHVIRLPLTRFPDSAQEHAPSCVASNQRPPFRRPLHTGGGLLASHDGQESERKLGTNQMVY